MRQISLIIFTIEKHVQRADIHVLTISKEITYNLTNFEQFLRCRRIPCRPSLRTIRYPTTGVEASRSDVEKTKGLVSKCPSVETYSVEMSGVEMSRCRNVWEPLSVVAGKSGFEQFVL